MLPGCPGTGFYNELSDHLRVRKDKICMVTETAMIKSNILTQFKETKKTADMEMVAHNRAMVPVLTLSEIALCSR